MAAARKSGEEVSLELLPASVDFGQRPPPYRAPGSPRAPLESATFVVRRAAARAPADIQRPSEPETDLDSAQQARIDAAVAWTCTANCYELLGVDESADRLTLRRAYHARAAVFHPDRFFRKRLGSFGQKLTIILTRLDDAYQTLSEPEQRYAYD